MRTLTVLMLATGLVVLAGCSDPAPSEDSEQPLEQAHRALDKARDVEDQLQQAARRQAEDIDRQAGGDDGG